MKYKICKLVDGNGNEWYQVKKKGWLFWNWIGHCEGHPEIPVFVTSTFSTYEDAKKWVEKDKKYCNSGKQKVVECVEV